MIQVKFKYGPGDGAAIELEDELANLHFIYVAGATCYHQYFLFPLLDGYVATHCAIEPKDGRIRFCVSRIDDRVTQEEESLYEFDPFDERLMCSQLPKHKKRKRGGGGPGHDFWQ